MRKGDIVYRVEAFRERFYVVLKAEGQNVYVARICSGIINMHTQFKMPKDVLHKCTCVSAVLEKQKLKSIMNHWPDDITRPYEKWDKFSNKLDGHTHDKHLIIKLYNRSTHFYVTAEYWTKIARPVMSSFGLEYIPFFKLKNVNPVY